MKIALVQSKPVKGDIDQNIINHIKWINAAVANGSDLVIFPELSITGYEPTLANELATHKDDERFDDFQYISNQTKVTIGAGMPIRVKNGINIGMIIFQPNQPRIVYAKKYLHADEEPYFVSGQQFPVLNVNENPVSLAICYELSIPQHIQTAYENKGSSYLASVAKTAPGAEKAIETLSGYAKKYSMITMMVNCVGHCDNFDSGGQTSVWNKNGSVLAQLNDVDEGVLLFDMLNNPVASMIYSH